MLAPATPKIHRGPAKPFLEPWTPVSTSHLGVRELLSGAPLPAVLQALEDKTVDLNSRELWCHSESGNAAASAILSEAWCYARLPRVFLDRLMNAVRRPSTPNTGSKHVKVNLEVIGAVVDILLILDHYSLWAELIDDKRHEFITALSSFYSQLPDKVTELVRNFLSICQKFGGELPEKMISTVCNSIIELHDKNRPTETTITAAGEGNLKFLAIISAHEVALGQIRSIPHFSALLRALVHLLNNENLDIVIHSLQIIMALMRTPTASAPLSKTYDKLCSPSNLKETWNIVVTVLSGGSTAYAWLRQPAIELLRRLFLLPGESVEEIQRMVMDEGMLKEIMINLGHRDTAAELVGFLTTVVEGTKGYDASESVAPIWVLALETNALHALAEWYQYYAGEALGIMPSLFGSGQRRTSVPGFMKYMATSYMTLPPEVPADLHETFHRQAKEVCTELLGYLYYLLENICMNAAETDTCLSFDEDPIASQWKVLESCELLKCWLGLEGIDLDEPELRDTWLLSLLHIGILETNLNSHGRNLAPQIRIAIVGLMFEICRDDFVATVLEELTDDDLLTLLTLLLHVLESDTRATVLDGAGIIMRRIVEMEGARMASVLASRNRSKDRSVVKQPSTRVTLPDTQRVASQSQSPSPPGHISDSPPASYPPANSQRSSSDLSQNAIAELTRLESSLATTRAHIQKEADLQVAIAAQKMALYASRTTALEDELKVWEGRTAELERELRKRDRRLTDLGTGMKTMEKEKEREATGRKEAESLASRLRGDLKLANQRTEALSKEMQDAKQNIEELTSANKQLNADVDTEKGQFATLEQDYVTFRQTAETRQATLEAEIATLNDQNAALQSSLMLLESKIKDRDERIRELEAANEELEAELGDRDQAQEEMFERMRISMSKGRKNRAGGDGSTVKRGREKNNQE